MHRQERCGTNSSKNCLTLYAPSCEIGYHEILRNLCGEFRIGSCSFPEGAKLAQPMLLDVTWATAIKRLANPDLIMANQARQTAGVASFSFNSLRTLPDVGFGGSWWLHGSRVECRS